MPIPAASNKRGSAAGSTEICGVPVAEERIETSARVARGKIASEIADAAEIVGSARRIRHDDRTRGVRISEVLIGFQKRYGYFESYGSEKLQELTP